MAVARIQHIYITKKTIGDSLWNSFGSGYDIPLLYYSPRETFVANPGEKFISLFHPNLIAETKTLKIYKLNFRLDSVPFHMQVSISYGKDTSAYDYYSPYIKCSSREEFESVTGYNASTRFWSALVLHECFHGFQFLHAGYLKKAIENGFIYAATGDSLQKLYRSNSIFKASIDSENTLLLQAARSDSKTKTNRLLEQFFSLRKKRRSQIKQVTGYDIELLEKSFETLEGTARFIEAGAQEHRINDKELNALDTGFSSLEGNDTSIIHLPDYLYNTNISEVYFYATGYNEVCLLKKMEINYETVLFKQPALTLEDILRTGIRASFQRQ